MTSYKIAEGADTAQRVSPQPSTSRTAADAIECVRRVREAQAFAAGVRYGVEMARRRREVDFERDWAAISTPRTVAGRPTYAERRRRELEWVKPKPGDFMGRLTAEEYFGMGRAA